MRFTRFVPLIVLLLPASLFAWGVDGHQIVCLIAEERLTPAAKAGVRKLLGPDFNMSDAEVAAWADNARREADWTAPWHYVDIPAEAAAFDARRDGHSGDNVVDQINHFANIVADSSKTDDQRQLALAYLLHFVGDIHQPMHCVDRDGDRGGNARLVFYRDWPRATNLHAVWDSTILLERRGTMRDLEFARQLNAKVTAEQAERWSTGTAEDWANESHAVANKIAYADVPPGGPPPKLGDAYIARAGEAIDEQLEKGGVRLAALLNECFDPKRPPTLRRAATMPTTAPASPTNPAGNAVRD